MFNRLFSGTTPEPTPQISVSPTSVTPSTSDFFENELKAYALITELKDLCNTYYNSSRFFNMTHGVAATYIISQLDELYKSDEAGYLFEAISAIFSALKDVLTKDGSKNFLPSLILFGEKYPNHFSHEKISTTITRKYGSVIQDLIDFLKENRMPKIEGETSKYPKLGTKHFETIYNQYEANAQEEAHAIAIKEKTTEEFVASELQAITMKASNMPTSEIYRSLSPVTFKYTPPLTPDLVSSPKLNLYQPVNKHFGTATFSFLSNQFMIHIQGIDKQGTYIEEYTFTKEEKGRFSTKISLIDNPTRFNLERDVMKESIHYSVSLSLSKRSEFISRIQNELGQPENFIHNNYKETLTEENYKALLIESYKAIIQKSYEATYGSIISLTQHHTITQQHRPKLG